MKALIPMGIIGTDQHAAALTDPLYPLPSFRVVKWAPAPGAALASISPRVGREAELASGWEEVVHDPALPVIVLLGGEGLVAPAVAALAAGKTVLCPSPLMSTVAEVEQLSVAAARGGGRFLCPGEVRHSPAGRHALRLIRDGELGTLHSVFLAMRSGTKGAGQRSLERMWQEALLFLAALTDAPVKRVHAIGGDLFGGGGQEDTTVGIVRFADGLVATLELSCCLPPSMPVAGTAEVEIELVGAHQMLRLLPNDTAVRVYHSTGADLRPWLDPPVRSMMESLADLLTGSADEGDDLLVQRRAIDLKAALRGALEL